MPGIEHSHSTEENTHEQPGSPERKAEATAKQQGTAETARLDEVFQAYVQQEAQATQTKIVNDAEYRAQRVEKNLGYVPYLEALLEEVKDRDEWFGDSREERAKERMLLHSAADAVRANLADIARMLDGSTGKSSRSYEKLRRVYMERSSRFAELLASVDENKENVELRDAEAAVKQVQETIRHMTTEEAIDWVSRMMSGIDSNDWQSSGLKETYGKLAMACRQALRVRLAQEKMQMLQDASLVKDYVRHCTNLAKLFTDRDSPIDSDLTDVDFAVEMAKEAMGFEELALRYAERILKEHPPIKQTIDAKRPGILEKIRSLPPETQQNPQVQQMMKMINASPDTIQGISAQYAVLRNLEAMFEGIRAVNVERELNELLSKPLEGAVAKFDTFLNGTWKGAANLDDIAAAVGPPGLSVQQREAWQLLANIQGYGYDIGDKTWSTIGAGAKIAAMIAAGIAIGVATGGAGFGVIGAALVGGAAMTATNAVINQQGFDNLSDAFDVYGKDFAVNATTMGAARYLAAGRAAFQLGRAGALSEAGGVRGLFQVAGQRGGLRIINSFDDASGIGTRLMGSTLEGGADTVIGATLDTAVQGGEFLDNLKNNAMFFGLGYAEFAGPAIRALRGFPDEELHDVAQMVQNISTGRTKLQEHCRGTGLDPKILMDAPDPQALLTKVHKGQADAITESVGNLRAQKERFARMMEEVRSISSAQASSGKGVLPEERMNEMYPDQTSEDVQEAARNERGEHSTAPVAIETPPAATDRFLKEAFFAAGGGRSDTGVSQDYANNVLAILVSSFDGNSPPEFRQRWRDTGMRTKSTYDEYIRGQINKWNADQSHPKVAFEDPAIQRLRREDLNAVVASISANDSEQQLREKLHTVAAMIYGDRRTKEIDRKIGYEQIRSTDAATADDVRILVEHARNNPSVLKDYLKQHDMNDTQRIQIAEQLLGHPFSEQQRMALIEAHNKPGEIDNLTQGQKTVKGLSLMRKGVFNRDEAQLILDAGLAGTPPPLPPSRKPSMPAEKQRSADALGSTPLKPLQKLKKRPPHPPPPRRTKTAEPQQSNERGKTDASMIRNRSPESPLEHAATGPRSMDNSFLRRVLDIANDADREMPIDPFLEKTAMEASKNEVVRIETTVDNEVTHRYQGYTGHGNAVALERDGIRRIHNDYLGDVPSDALGKLLQYVTHRGYPAQSMESIRLSTQRSTGERVLSYLYFGGNYRGARGNERKGVRFDVEIRMDAKKAEAVYQALQKHPQDARAFFVAASQNVERSDYLWNDVRPDYTDSDFQRKLIFVEENRKDISKPPLHLLYTERNNDGQWQEQALPNHLKALFDKAMLEGKERQKGELNRATQPQRTEIKKPGLVRQFFSFFRRLLGG